MLLFSPQRTLSYLHASSQAYKMLHLNSLARCGDMETCFEGTSALERLAFPWGSTLRTCSTFSLCRLQVFFGIAMSNLLSSMNGASCRVQSAFASPLHGMVLSLLLLMSFFQSLPRVYGSAEMFDLHCSGRGNFPLACNPQLQPVRFFCSRNLSWQSSVCQVYPLVFFLCSVILREVLYSIFLCSAISSITMLT